MTTCGEALRDWGSAHCSPMGHVWLKPGSAGQRDAGTPALSSWAQGLGLKKGGWVQTHTGTVSNPATRWGLRACVHGNVWTFQAKGPAHLSLTCPLRAQASC